MTEISKAAQVANLANEVVSVKDFGAVGDGVTDDTSAIQAAIDYVSVAISKKLVIDSGNYAITGCTLNTSNIHIDARGARFILTSDSSVCFNLNSGATPSSIEGSSSSYIYWQGGVFTSSLTNPTDATAFQVYAIRQCKIVDTVIGEPTINRFSSGIKIAGLGAHKMENIRFLNVTACFDCPDWGTDTHAASNWITTSHFIGNEFILKESQQAFKVLGGYQRWRIQGGFLSGSENVAAMYFADKNESRMLTFASIGFEQAKQNSKWVHLASVEGNAHSNIAFESCWFNGNPAGGGHNAVELEKCSAVEFANNRFESNPATGNKDIVADADCSDFSLHRSNKFSTSNSIDFLGLRRGITSGVESFRLPNVVLSGYNGDAKSTGAVTLDMSTLLGSNYPAQLPPTGYNLTVQARDATSSSSLNARVEFMTQAGDVVTRRQVVDLRGVTDDRRVSSSFNISADNSGDIALEVFASGVDTVDLWIYVSAVYN